jgi:hypothetical protein
MEKVMMKCGCAAQGLRHMDDGLKVPCCITHSCIEVCEPPNLKGRKARCAYYGKSTYKNECNYGQDRDSVCTCEQPSSLELPFFEFLGEGSPDSTERCKCGYMWIAHQPRWMAEIEVDQKWFKCPREKQINKREFHSPEGKQQEYAEQEASFWRDRIGNEYNKDTPVFGVEVKSVKPVQNPLKCKKFEAIGAQPFDKFYCGCRSWD